MNKTATKKISVKLTLFAVILAFVVIVLGAYTRLTDAGLGCPDWPGCYNQLVAPTSQKNIAQADKLFPTMPVHVTKAWTEMVHRYVAGILGLIIFTLGILAIRRRKAPNQPLVVPIILMGVVIFQGLLGKWTVTMKLLPAVVMGHLLGGFTIIALLWWFNLKAGEYFISVKAGSSKNLRPWAILGIIIVACQIALGGWTSANYAALVCPNFPYCLPHEFFPQVDFKGAFNILDITDIHLSHAALITIQMTHRIGALVTGFYVGLLSLYLIFSKNKPVFHRIGFIMLAVLITQISLGVLNIELLLPLWIAILHNAVAALLLLTMVTFLYASSQDEKNTHRGSFVAKNV